jgi:hypothetical protein
MGSAAPTAEDAGMENGRAEGGGMQGRCPVCHQGDLITIAMSVSGNELAFTTCHMCEAKWWYRDGESVPLRSVIGSVLQHGS